MTMAPVSNGTMDAAGSGAKASEAAANADSLANLIACPQCDALYVVKAPAHGERAVCMRCQSVLIAPRRGSFAQVVALSLAVLVLMAGALFLPFLAVHVSGFSNATSVVGAALAFFDGGLMTALAIAVGIMIVAIPVLRALLMLYVLLPLTVNRPPAPLARTAFRVSEEMRPWSMAEIFIVGCAVALVKVGDLARIDFGPAFFMLAAMVVVTVARDAITDRWAIWRAMDRDING